MPSSPFAFVVAAALLAAGCSEAADADRQLAQDVTGAEDGANGAAESDGEAPESESPASQGAAAARGKPDGATVMAAAPSSVSVAIDGEELVVDDIVLWSDVSQPGDYDLFLEVHGPGVPSGSDVHVSASKLGAGCDQTSNFLTFRPAGETKLAPASTAQPSCGLDIDALPTGRGSRFIGAFAGTLRATDTTTPGIKTLALTFDVLRDD